MDPRSRGGSFSTWIGETLESCAIEEEVYKGCRYPYPSTIGDVYLPSLHNLLVQHPVPCELVQAEAHHPIQNPLKHDDCRYLPLFAYEDACDEERRTERGLRPKGCYQEN